MVIWVKIWEGQSMYDPLHPHTRNALVSQERLSFFPKIDRPTQGGRVVWNFNPFATGHIFCLRFGSKSGI